MSLNTILATAPLTATGYHLKATGTALGQSLIWDNGTNVGIGNTNTSYTLDVSGSGRYNGSYAGHLLNVQNTNASYYSSTDYYDNAGIEKLIVGYGNASTGNALASKAIIYGTSGVGLNFYTNGSTTAKMVIDTSGNVGIGTTNPQMPLSVQANTGNGAIRLIGTSNASSNNAGIYWYDSNDSTFNGYLGNFSGSFDIYNHRSTPMVFSTAGTERMRISSAGNVSIGTTTDNGYRLYVQGSGGQGSGWIQQDAAPALYVNRTTNDGGLIIFLKAGTQVGVIATNTYTLPSDFNFKKNINTLDLGLNLITKLRPVSYNHKIDDDDAALSTGFIAQELEKSLEELGVEENKYYILQHKPNEKEGESQYWVDYQKFIPVLVKAIQEMNTKLDEQNQTIQNLQEQINILAK